MFKGAVLRYLISDALSLLGNSIAGVVLPLVLLARTAMPWLPDRSRSFAPYRVRPRYRGRRGARPRQSQGHLRRFRPHLRAQRACCP